MLPFENTPFVQNSRRTANHEASGGKVTPKAMRNIVPFDWLASIANRRVMPCLSFYLRTGSLTVADWCDKASERGFFSYSLRG